MSPHDRYFESMREHYERVENFLAKKLEEGYILNWIEMRTELKEEREQGFIVGITAISKFYYKPRMGSEKERYLGSVN